MSFDFSQFKGVHKVTKKPERVWVGRWWSIEVPVGFSYTVDPEKAGGGGMGTYQLHIQNSKDCNFDISYSSVFNVVVYGNMEGINRNCDDMSDDAMLQSLDEFPTHFLGHYQIYKCSRDLVVLYKVMEESKEYTSYEFQVITRGCNLVFTGQFNLQTGTISERKKTILQWLDTIDVLTQDERLSFTDYSGKAISKIPTKYSKTMAAIDKGVKISIPVGFHAETNQAVISDQRNLVIVPDNYSFSDDPMEAPVAFSVQSSVMKNIPTRADLLNTYFEFFCDRGVPFEKNSVIGMYKNSDKAFTVSQFFTGEYYAKAFSFLFANNNVYILHIIINYPDPGFDGRLAVWDIDHLAKAWLARIQVEGETVPNYPSRSSSTSVKKSLPTIAKATPSLDLYPHYKQLGNTTVPKTDLGGIAVIVTNPGGTEFESYPFSHFDGELKAVAERAISKDSCSKEFKQLVTTATTYATLFRVNKDKFNPKEDRECDIRNLRMRRAYQLHVLRSFAWTLAEQASLQQKSLSDLVIDDYQKVFTAIEKREYLNYQGESHFPTLCGTADLHVFFVPDKTTKVDKKTLNDSGEVFGSIIPNTVGSLDGLRKDLLALAETMEKLFQWLLNTRDYSKPLIGPGADALYAWCTLVLSAETPFYVEDGPMTCFYTQISEPSVPALSSVKKTQATSSTTEKKASEKAASSKTASTKAKSTAPKPQPQPASPIQPNIGKPSVTSVSAMPNDWKDAAKDIKEKAVSVIAKNKCTFPSGSRVYDFECEVWGDSFSEYSGSSKNLILQSGIKDIGMSAFRDADIRSVVIPQGVTKLNCSAFESCIDLTHVSLPSSLREIEFSTFEGCSNLVYVELPYGIKKIENSTFSNCSNLEAIIIPEGCTSIGSWAFQDCTSLKYVFLPSTLREIGQSAFNGCWDLEKIVIPDGCTSIDTFAFEDCTSLTDIYIPASVSKFGTSVIGDNEGLVVHVKKGSPADDYILNDSWAIAYDFYGVGVDQVSNRDQSLNPDLDEALGEGVFQVVNGKVIGLIQEQEWDDWGEVAVPEGIRAIGERAFLSKNGGKRFCGTIELPEGLEKIEGKAFLGCKPSGFLTVVIPPTVSYIAEDAFNENSWGKPKFDCVEGSYAENYAKRKGYEVIHKDSSKWIGLECKTAEEFGIERLAEIKQQKREALFKSELIKIAKKVKIEAPKAYRITENGTIEQYSGRAKIIEIPDGVMTIKRSFATCAGVKKAEAIVFPASVISIDKNTEFADGTKLIAPPTPFFKGYFESHTGNFEYSEKPEDAKYMKAIQKIENAEAKAQKEAEEAQKRAEEERKRIEEEKRIAQAAALLQQKLTAAYQDQLTVNQFESLKNTLSSEITGICDKKTWVEIQKRGLQATPSVHLEETNKRISEAAAPEEAYEMLPEWVATEYIGIAEEKRSRQKYVDTLNALAQLSKEPVLPDFERNLGKVEYENGITSKAIAIIGEEALFDSWLKKYSNFRELEALRLILKLKEGDSAKTIIDALRSKKAAEYQRLEALLEKRSNDLEAIRQEEIHLKEERSHLGLFQGKRKKEIAALLEKIPERIKQVEDEYEAEKSKI